jgi:hypothetical protein
MSSRIVTVARLHLVDRFSYTWLVWGVLTFTFLVNYALFAAIGPFQEDGSYTGALLAIYIFMIIIGIQAATRFLPFALTLGVSRRTYYLGTVALVVGLCAAYAGLLTVLWWVEGLTDGWGIRMNFFRVPWILDGPWYQVLLTNFVLLSLIFLAGLLFGLIHRRFGTIGMVLFGAVLVLVLLGVVLVVTWQRWWPQVGNVLADLDILAATGILAIFAAVTAVAGYGAIRGLRV